MLPPAILSALLAYRAFDEIAANRPAYIARFLMPNSIEAYPDSNPYLLQHLDQMILKDYVVEGVSYSFFKAAPPGLPVKTWFHCRKDEPPCVPPSKKYQREMLLFRRKR